MVNSASSSVMILSSFPARALVPSDLSVTFSPFLSPELQQNWQRQPSCQSSQGRDLLLFEGDSCVRRELASLLREPLFCSSDKEG